MAKQWAAWAFLGVLLALASGCGESRYEPSAPGGPSGSVPGGGVAGPRYVCEVDSTGKVHINKMNPTSGVILDQVVVNSTGDIFHLQVFVWQVPDWKGQVFTATLERNGVAYEFKRPGAACAVVQDTLANDPLPSIQLRDVGTLTGLPPGTYTLVLHHAFENPCYHPPADIDDGWQYIDTFPSPLAICRLVS